MRTTTKASHVTCAVIGAGNIPAILEIFGAMTVRHLIQSIREKC